MKQDELHNPLTGRTMTLRRRMLDVGEYGSDGSKGPLLVVLTGIHGNEPSGPLALDAVASVLNAGAVEVCGRVVGLICNLEAMRQGVRFVDEDMNRVWLPARLKVENPDSTEVRELQEVVRVLDELPDGPDRYFLDCHSVSSESVPFISSLGEPSCVEVTTRVPALTVVGAGDQLQGVSDRYLFERGYRGFTFEAGRHDELASIEAQEAMIWTMLHRVGCLDQSYARAEPRLSRYLFDGQRQFQVEYVHRIAEGADFHMQPGYFNFRRVTAGELLAHESGEPVYCHADGRIYMPLYQRLGTHGFTVVSEIED